MGVVGWGVGSELGSSVGTSEGRSEGLALVGSKVGFEVSVCGLVVVGDIEGKRVGSGDGIAVGMLALFNNSRTKPPAGLSASKPKDRTVNIMRRTTAVK